MNKLKAGVVGCGLITKEKHIPALLKMDNIVTTTAVCDLDNKVAKKTATEFKIPSYYSDIGKMISSEDLDVVDICVPPQAHASVALPAIENGCNIIMEKPFALNTSDCDKMIEASKKHCVKLCIIHNDLFHPPFLEAKKIISKGSIGDFIGMRIFLCTPTYHMLDLKDHWYHKLPGGMIGETGPHIAYMSAEFLNNIDKVDIFAKNILKKPWIKHDEFRIYLEGDNGFSSATLSYTTNYWSAKVDLLGTDAALYLDLEKLNLIKHNLKDLSVKNLAKSSLGSISQRTKNFIKNGFSVFLGSSKVGTDIIIERFINSIIENTPPPVSGEQGRETVRIMEKVVERYNTKYK